MSRAPVLTPGMPLATSKFWDGMIKGWGEMGWTRHAHVCKRGSSYGHCSFHLPMITQSRVVPRKVKHTNGKLSLALVLRRCEAEAAQPSLKAESASNGSAWLLRLREVDSGLVLELWLVLPRYAKRKESRGLPVSVQRANQKAVS